MANNQSQTQISFYAYDGHGSVRGLRSTIGAITDTYDYDAFGNLLHSTGTTFNEFLFAGEQFDSDLGLYYNRARYLNVSTGRFWTMDTFEGDPESPTSLHKYLFAEVDPVNKLDPSGHQILAYALAAVALIVVVAALTYMHFHPHPFKIGLQWSVSQFNWKNYRGQKHSIQGPLTSSEVATVKSNALYALKLAYSPFGANVIEGPVGSSDHTVEVKDTGLKCAGTAFSPSHYSFVSYECAMNHAQFALSDYERDNVIPGIGFGIGNLAAHEVGHQIGPTVVNREIDMPGFYDGVNSSDPTVYDGTPQQWSGQSLEELPNKVRPFF